MVSLFISDLHLGPERPELTRAFDGFCERLPAQNIARLYILGDLFEAWIGDDDDSDFAEQVTQILRRLAATGVQILCQRGNRDFLLGARFARRTSCQLLPDYQLVEESGHQALLMHGDLLCTDDRDYQRFRRKVQNPLYRWTLSHLPLSYRRNLALRWRMKSANANANKAENIMDVNLGTVAQIMAQRGTTTLIHGHTHRPASHALQLGGKPAQRLVLGDWGDHIWWIRGDCDGYSLISAPLEEFC